MGYECFVSTCGKEYEKESHRNQHYARSNDDDHVKHRKGEFSPSLEDSFNDAQGEETPDSSSAASSAQVETESGQDKPPQENTEQVEIPMEKDSESDSNDENWRDIDSVSPREIEQAADTAVDGLEVLRRLKQNPEVSEVNLEDFEAR